MNIVGCRLLLILAITRIGCLEAANYSGMFVFGDSYVDTGNYEPNTVAAWIAPYGISWPGNPSGRYSDGHVFTDFYASSLNLSSPTQYRVIKSALNSTSDEETDLESLVASGINFAFGGSGVGPTFSSNIPTVYDQINFLKGLIGDDVVSIEMIKSSVVLLVVAGNDYAAFIQNHYNIELLTFISSVVARMGAFVQELYGLGFRTLAVTNLEPVGCLPNITSSNNYTACNGIANIGLSSIHNSLLALTISMLQIKHLDARIILLDFYKAFSAIVQGGDLPLRPCCEGVHGSECGDVDANGNVLYTICLLPEQSLFWDSFHPSNSGWEAISKALLSSSS